jgi:hypothetical protein
MKRSSMIILGASGVLLLAAFWPRGVTTVGGTDTPAAGDGGFETVGTTDTFLAFGSADECKLQGVEAARCDSEFQRAQADHALNAPKFGNREECEGQYGAGQCQSATIGGSSVFLPVLAGFMMARAIQGAQPGQALLPPRTGPAVCPPGSALPECRPPQQSTAASGGGGGGGGSARRYSTARGWNVTVGGGTAARTTVNHPRIPTGAPSTIGRAPSAPSSGWSTPSGNRSGAESSTVSRGGFGSSGRSFGSTSS